MFFTLFLLLGSNYQSPSFIIKSVEVEYAKPYQLWKFSMGLEGEAGAVVPKLNGQIDGAEVLGYVFLTNLKPEAVGFKKVEGKVALAVTSHPDFDDTPLWDEDQDGNFQNDGVIYHTHWVVLGEDSRVPGGLAVKAAAKESLAEVLPPTAPGMPMYMDSPGYEVWLDGQALHVFVPKSRIDPKTKIEVQGVTALMKVSTQGKLPMLGVYQVFSQK